MTHDSVTQDGMTQDGKARDGMAGSIKMRASSPDGPSGDNRAGAIIVALLVAVALWPGIMNRLDELYPASAIATWYGGFKHGFPGLGLDRLAVLSPKKYGTGYWLGVAGTTGLVLLLMYSLRKRWPVMHHLGRMGGWLRLHILLGALVPVLILYHCNFRFGALNSNVALVAMLTVAASGIIGRYLFIPAHAELHQLRDLAEARFTRILEAQWQICDGLPEGRQLISDLASYNSTALSAPRNLRASLALGQKVLRRTPRTQSKLLKRNLNIIHGIAQANRWPEALLQQWLQGTTSDYGVYFSAIADMKRTALRERLLSYWDPLHLPLSIVMLLAALAHIIVVHTYSS